MFGKMGMNVVFLCVALVSAVGAVNYPPMAGAQGVDSYTKLMLHADGSDQGTSFTDSASGAKTVTNADSSTAPKAVTNAEHITVTSN